MAKYKRMINCDFVNASSFKLKISNRAKLLYFYMLSSADDKGFIDNVDELVELLDSNDRKFGSESNATLMPDNFETAFNELFEKGLVYKFEDNHCNKICLIKHWYLHNQIPAVRVRESSYEKYLDQVIINDDKEYEFKKNAKQLLNNCQATAKQVSSNCQADDSQLLAQNKINKSKVNKSKLVEEITNNAPACVEDNNSLEIPSKWTSDAVSLGLKLEIKQLHGESLTEKEISYLDAFKKNRVVNSDDNELF